MPEKDIRYSTFVGRDGTVETLAYDNNILREQMDKSAREIHKGLVSAWLATRFPERSRGTPSR